MDREREREREREQERERESERERGLTGGQLYRFLHEIPEGRNLIKR